LAAKGRLNDEEMVETILTFLAAGVETTSAALTWTLHLLTLPENVKYQARLRQEIRNKLPKDGCHSITHRDLQTLPLLHGIIEESLRLHPPVPLIPYNAVRDTEMAGQFVPAGTKVVYWAWALNRNPDQWGSDAECMNPYRWISTDELGIERPNKHGGALSHYSHETFLQGPRGCVGKETSKATLRAAVAKLILGFDVSRDPTGTLAPPSRGAAVVRPIKSLKLNFSPVDVSGG
jgi:cytochrome P450